MSRATGQQILWYETALKAAKEAIYEALISLRRDGTQVYAYVPEVIGAPAIVIQPGDPYLSSEGEPYGLYRVRFRLMLVADVAVNEVATKALDNLICDAIEALSGDFAVEQVEEPYAFRTNEDMHLAADLIISDSIDIRREQT